MVTSSLLVVETKFWTVFDHSFIFRADCYRQLAGVLGFAQSNFNTRCKLYTPIKIQASCYAPAHWKAHANCKDPKTPFIGPTHPGGLVLGYQSQTLQLTFLDEFPSPCKISAWTAIGPWPQKPPLHLDLLLDTYMRPGTWSDLTRPH